MSDISRIKRKLSSKATEKKSELAGLGLRIDNERDFQPSIEIRDENFLGAATEIGAYFGAGCEIENICLNSKRTGFSIRTIHSI